MSEQERSEQTCPVCRKNTLALDQPPQIDVMGVQAYSDMLGMGDLKNEGSLGIICRSCDTRWRDRDAFDRNEPEPPLDEADVDDASPEFDLEADDEE